MSQYRPPLFDEVSRLMSDAAGVAQGVRREAETIAKTQIERILSTMNVVTREEFEAVRDMAALMGDDSLLYVEVPHENIMRNSVIGENITPGKRLWHEHVNFYRECSLDALLRVAGLRPIQAATYAVDGGGHPAHIQSVLARKVAANVMQEAAE